MLKTPAVIEAGVPFVVDIELDAGDNNCGNQPNGHFVYECDLVFLEIYFAMDLLYDPETSDHMALSGGFPHCYLAPCVGTNVTSVSLTLPGESIPDNTDVFVPHKLQYRVWRPLSNESIERLTLSVPGDSTLFNVTKSEAPVWTGRDRLLTISHTEDLPCESLGCARQCELDLWDKKLTLNGSEACIHDCPEYGREKAEMGCVLENARDSPGPSETTGNGGPSPTEVSDSGDTIGADSAGEKLGLSSGLVMGMVLAALL